MIHRIYFDLDETLIHTFHQPPNEDHFVHSYSGFDYFTVINNDAIEMLQFARSLVGFDNVYVLTAAIRDYARTVCDVGKFNFSYSHIFSREDLAESRRNKELAVTYQNTNNVLIDNLYPGRENIEKMDFLGIDVSRYCKVDDFYSNKFTNPRTKEHVKSFLTKLMES
jgi:hypothetical protein